VKVAVIGGGVGGLSAAHELALRDFDVVVYEQRDVAGGKARSMDAIPGAGGRRALPGEHGFRFFPGFYRHLPDTMSRIPYGHNVHGVFDNLVASTQIQTFYSIFDGSNAKFNASSDLPTGLSFPLSRSNLADDTGNSLTGVTINPDTQMGWFEDLGQSASGRGWRVVSDSDTFFGTVNFAAIMPDGGVCDPSGNSRIYGRDYATAITTLTTTNAQNQVVDTAYVAMTGTITDVRTVSVAGKAVLIAGTNLGDVKKVDTKAGAGMPLRRLNWRELQTVD